MNNFDSVSSVYDFLSFIVFGNSVIKAQKAHFSYIRENNSILICGGGTGKILEELDKLNLSLSIEYVELSEKMILKAEDRLPFNNIKVEFVNRNLLETELGNYDVVMTPFFLDCFNKENLITVINKLSKHITPLGLFICTDFKKANNLISEGLIRLMYQFFKITANLEGKELNDFDALISKRGLQKLKSERFYFGMIESNVYQL